MKILVLGAAGQIGTELMRAAWDEDAQVTGLGRSQCDITRADRVRAAIDDHGPDMVINAAAYTSVDGAEGDKAAAFAANAHGPEILASACSRSGVPLLHLSTDYVFSGMSVKPYHEVDPVAPVNTYGLSKAAGEAAIRSRHSRHIIVRTAWVYSPHATNFVKTMLRLAGERDEIGVVADQFGTPTSAADIAAALVAIARELGSTGRSDENAMWGTYHYTALGETSWHGLADHVFAHLERVGRRRPRLKPIATADYPTPARRPANSRLECSRIERTFAISRAPWETSLDRVLGELVPHDAAQSIQNRRPAP